MSYVLGHTDWGVDRDKEGHRDYFVDWLVQVDHPSFGPAIAMATPGLPAVGATWAFGAEYDLNAYCHPDWKVSKAHVRNEPSYYWTVRQTYSTRPLKRCQDSSIENPLAEPPKLSGGFTKLTKAVFKDRHGKPLKSSSHEPYTGAETEFDDNRPNVCIEFNSLFLPLSTFSPMIDTVNDGPMWGLGPRRIKLSNASWQRQVYGTCSFYYTLRFEFDVNEDTFDRPILDRGHKCLAGWAPGHKVKQIDPDGTDLAGDADVNWKNPKNFMVYKDKLGENTICLLDGKGRPVENPDDDAVYDNFEHYPENNFLTLGIPASL